MDFTMRWIQRIFSPKQIIFSVSLAGVMMVTGAAMAVSTSGTFNLLPELVVCAKEQSQSVNAQVDYLYKLAKKEIRTGDTEKGKILLQQVLALDPQHKAAKKELVGLAENGSSISMDNRILAAAEGTDLPSMDSLSSTELVDVAKAMMADMDYVSAKKTLEAALKKSKDAKERRLIQSYLNAITKEQEKFQQTRLAQLEYNLSALEKQLQKSAIYLESGQYSKAKSELEKAKQISPEDERIQALESRIGEAMASQQEQQIVLQDTKQKQVDVGKLKAAETIFYEGVSLYKQGQIIEAVQKWNDALKIYPEHQASKTYITNTRAEYQQAIRAKEAAEKQAAEEAKFEKMLDTEIYKYSTQGERVDIKNVISFLSNLSGLNVIMGENLEGKVAFDVKNTTVRGILNLLQKQYGYLWHRDKDTVFVERGFKTEIFPLTDEQFKTLKSILNDPTILEDFSKNLKTILYGPNQEFDVPGKQLYLNSNTRSLVVTDSPANLTQVEEFLKKMPEITEGKKPVIIRVYKLDSDVATEIYEMVKVVLYGDLGAYDVRDNRRKLFLESNSNSLIVIDTPENIEKVEEILTSQQITDKLEEGDLIAKQFTITDIDDVEDTPEAFARREEFVTAVAEIIDQMLYGRTGRDAAKLQGRITRANPARGTIDIVDTRENIRRVEEYLNSIRGETTQDILIESFPIKHVDVFVIFDALAALFFDSQQSTRPTRLSENIFQSIGTDETGETGDVSNVVEESSRQMFNVSGGGGGSTDLVQYFTVRFYPDVNTNSIVVFTLDQDVLDLVTRVINTFDKPQRMIELENRVVTVSLTDLRSINFDYVLSNPFQDSISFDPDEQLSNIQMIQQNQPGFNMSLNTLGTSRLDFAMNLLEDADSANTLAAPKIMSVANPMEPPQIFIGSQIPYVDDISIDDQGDDDPTNNRLEYDFQRAMAGVNLAFIPYILNDDHVYIEMAPNITSAGERLPLQVTGQGSTEGLAIPDIGPLVFQQSMVRTSVRMKNGQTMVLGGMIQENESKSESRVPILHKIPFLGNLFKDTSTNKTKDTALIFVTARIIEPEY